MRAKITFHFDPGFLIDELVRRACDNRTGNAGFKKTWMVLENVRLN